MYVTEAGYEQNTSLDGDGTGSKWSLPALYAHIEADVTGAGGDGPDAVAALKAAIDDLVCQCSCAVHTPTHSVSQDDRV